MVPIAPCYKACHFSAQDWPHMEKLGGEVSGWRFLTILHGATSYQEVALMQEKVLLIIFVRFSNVSLNHYTHKQPAIFKVEF